jgi:glutamine cyclotransferase
MLRRYCVLGVLLLTIAISSTASPSSVDVASYQIVHTFPHDPTSFTQGLLFVDGHLYESTGLRGHSSIRMVDVNTGRTLQKYDMPPDQFGEGLTEWNNTLVQLTWQAHKGFVYDRFSFALLRTFSYAGEGWGLTHDDKRLIMSDGTSDLRFLDPKTFRETGRIHVTSQNGQPVEDLNELEYVHGEVYANIWHSDRIARISPRTGKVLGWIDLTGLRDPRTVSNPDAVLNGIAYDSKDNRLFVTGKLWPKLYEIKVVPK